MGNKRTSGIIIGAYFTLMLTSSFPSTAGMKLAGVGMLDLGSFQTISEMGKGITRKAFDVPAIGGLQEVVFPETPVVSNLRGRLASLAEKVLLFGTISNDPAETVQLGVSYGGVARNYSTYREDESDRESMELLNSAIASVMPTPRNPNWGPFRHSLVRQGSSIRLYQSKDGKTTRFMFLRRTKEEGFEIATDMYGRIITVVYASPGDAHVVSPTPEIQALLESEQEYWLANIDDFVANGDRIPAD
jgi:hypothetical protein